MPFTSQGLRASPWSGMNSLSPRETAGTAVFHCDYSSFSPPSCGSRRLFHKPLTLCAPRSLSPPLLAFPWTIALLKIPACRPVGMWKKDEEDKLDHPHSGYTDPHHLSCPISGHTPFLLRAAAVVLREQGQGIHTA